MSPVGHGGEIFPRRRPPRPRRARTDIAKECSCPRFGCFPCVERHAVRCGVPAPFPVRLLLRGVRRGLRCSREGDRRFGAAALGRAQGDVAARLLDRTGHDRQAEARAGELAGRRGAPEAFEDVGELVGGDAGAVVPDRERPRCSTTSIVAPDGLNFTALSRTLTIARSSAAGSARTYQGARSSVIVSSGPRSRARRSAARVMSCRATTWRGPAGRRPGGPVPGGRR